MTLLDEVRRIPRPARARAIRKAAGVSIRRVAEELGVDFATVYRWERGLNRPTGERRIAYGNLLEGLRQVVAER
jgi:transcriptional regulator with XRE-family HTH domain